MHSLTTFSIRYYLSERFRLRFEDSGLEDMMDENGELNAEIISFNPTDEAIDVNTLHANDTNAAMKFDDPQANPFLSGEIRTLDGELAGDEFAADAINYQVLLGKIDALLERLKLDA